MSLIYLASINLVKMSELDDFLVVSRKSFW